jgi:hypothetical protein
MKTFLILSLILVAATAYALEPVLPLLAQIEPTKPVDMKQAQPRMMTMYEQGWHEGVPVGRSNSGRAGWFLLGFANVPFMWLPWVVEPTHPAKPPIMAEEEFNSGFKNGYRAGWKNSHKAFYIAGTIVSSAAATAVILSNQ